MNKSIKLIFCYNFYTISVAKSTTFLNSQSSIYKFLRKNTIYKSTKIEEKTVDSTRNICLPAPSLYKYPWHVLVELKAGQTKPTLLYSPIGG